jgi:hypothetical protein
LPKKLTDYFSDSIAHIRGKEKNRSSRVWHKVRVGMISKYRRILGKSGGSNCCATRTAGYRENGRENNSD